VVTTYRISRDIEASIIDALTTNVNADWTGVTVVKTFKRVYTFEPPVICVRVGTTTHDWIEIGDNATTRAAQVLIDVFGSSDGNRLDLKDYIIEKVKNGFIFYEHVIANGVVQSSTANGRIRVLDITDSLITIDTDQSTVHTLDRFRHLVELEVSTGQMET
jgi:hypothetical protein